mgnify:CR=1 FL=1
MALVCTVSLAACGGSPAEKDPTPTEAGNTNENNEENNKPDDADKEKDTIFFAP